jgi:CRP/FNR family transcriptional regulator, cyclic AMP receptor protein
MAAFEEKTFDIGQTLFKEGEPGNNAYLIKSGKVKIVKDKGDDSKRTLATIGGGHIIGEMALIDDKPRAASAVALDLTVAMVISKDNFQERLGKTDPVIVRLLNTFADRLREQSQRVVELMT